MARDGESTASGSSQNPAQVIQQLRLENQRVQNELRQQLQQMQAQLQARGGGRALGMPKFLKLEPYDGQRGDVRSFLTQAKAYLRVNSTITGAAGRILCVGNLLTGRAFEWWEPTLRDYLDHKNDAERDEETNHTFASYGNFEEKLRQAFEDPDEERTATRHLKNLRQTGLALVYNREFRRLASKLNLGESALQEYFYDGLRDDVKDELSKMDKPDSFDEYVNMAIKIDNRNYQRRQE